MKWDRGTRRAVQAAPRAFELKIDRDNNRETVLSSKARPRASIRNQCPRVAMYTRVRSSTIVRDRGRKTPYKLFVIQRVSLPIE